MNITTIELPIYNLDIVAIIDDSWDIHNKKFKLQLDQEDLQYHALTSIHPEYRGKHEIYVLFKPVYLDYNTITHELMHIVMYSCSLIGIEPEVANDEPLAYLQGYIGQKLFEFRDKYIEKSLEVKKN